MPAEKRAPREALGHLKCLVCGARVLAKIDAGGHVYYRCDGNHDSKACGSRVIFGATHSDNLQRQASHERPSDPEPRPPEPERAPEPDRRSFLDRILGE